MIRKRVVLRILNVFWIPVPVGKYGTCLDCTDCGATLVGESTRSNHFDVMKHLLLIGARSRRDADRTGHSIDGGSQILLVESYDRLGGPRKLVRLLSDIYTTMTGEFWSEDEITKGLMHSQEGARSVGEYLAREGPFLGEKGRGQMLRACLMLVAEDGRFDEGEKQFVLDVSQGLRVSLRELRDLISDLVPPERSDSGLI